MIVDEPKRFPTRGRTTLLLGLTVLGFVLSLWCCGAEAGAFVANSAAAAAAAAAEKDASETAALIFARCALHTLLSQLLTCQRASCSSACSCSSLWPLHNRESKTAINYTGYFSSVDFYTIPF
jgi:hypothetical protein